MTPRQPSTSKPTPCCLKAGEIGKFVLSFDRNILRPTYTQLYPFVHIGSSIGVMVVGTPELQPLKDNQVKFSHTYTTTHWKLTNSLAYKHISGRRQVSFLPVKMLVIVCLFVVIFESVFHQENKVLGLKFNVQELDDIIAWINSQKSWATLFLQSFYILPTWLVFPFIGYWNENVELGLWIIYMYITYRQLFGYGWWGTLWRLAVLFLVVSTTAVFAVVIIGIIYDSDQYDAFYDILIVLAAVVMLETIILYVTHRINKRSYRRATGQQRVSPDNEKWSLSSKS